MSKREYIARYMHVVNFLRRKGEASFAEICDLLEREGNEHGFKFVISQRTFQRDIQEIYTLYGISIESNKSTKKYFIASEEETHNNSRMLETFDLYNALKFSSHYTPFIQFEKRIASGTEHIFALLHAIKNRVVIKFIYQKFYLQQAEHRVVEPLLLKEFKGRWYLIAQNINENNIRTFGLDRMNEIETLRQKFTKPNYFDADNYFKNAFGIIAPSDDKPERVVISFNPEQGRYIKTYPIHHSQKIILENNNQIQFELTVFLTYDFILELLSYGDNISVIVPKRLTTQVKKIYSNALKKY